MLHRRFEGSLRTDPGARRSFYGRLLVLEWGLAVLALVVEVETVFFHCAKAFLRSRLWDPESWDPEGVVPRRAVLAAELEPGTESLAELDAYYGPTYAENLY